MFAAMFNNISLRRVNEDGSRVQDMPVPLEMGPRDAYIEREEKDPNVTRSVGLQLPIMAYELVDLGFDPKRLLPITTKALAWNNGKAKVVPAPIPYRYVYRLHVRTKHLQDQYQIAEKILPYFRPKFNMLAELIDDMNCPLSVDVVIDGGPDMTDTYEGVIGTKRSIVWTYTFTMFGWLVVPEPDDGGAGTKLIKWIRVGLGEGQDPDTMEQSNTYVYMDGTNIEDIQPNDPYVIKVETWTGGPSV